MTSKEMLGELLANHYAEAFEAKKQGKLVAWATSISPQELLETMDITVVYPENHAAAIGARTCAL
ncbi:MAG: 2-hydroxyacyl-CoA dehydratase, partial [Pygmaiobacter sp.]